MPPNHEKPQNKKGSYFRNYLIQRAENGTQTRDPQLGRLVLTNCILVFLVLLPVRWLNNSFTLNFEMAYLLLVCCCVFHMQSCFKVTFVCGIKI